MEQMITQEQIDKAWGNANFGNNVNKLDIIKLGLLKCASGFYQGHTSLMIISELGLVTKEYELTALGRACLWEWYRNGSNF